MIRLLGRTYQEPEAVRARIEEGGSSLTVRTALLSRGRSLADAWTPDPCLSFDPGDSARKRGTEGIRPTWRAAAAEPVAPVTRTEMFFVSRSLDDLVRCGGEMTFIGAPGADETLERAWDAIPA